MITPITVLVVSVVSAMVVLLTVIWKSRGDPILMWYLAVFSVLTLIAGYFIPWWALLLLMTLVFLVFALGD